MSRYYTDEQIEDMEREEAERLLNTAPAPSRLSVSIRPVIDRLSLAMEVAKHTESPIETMLAVAILRQWPDVEFRTIEAGFSHGWTLIPQYPWGKFRVDLALRKPNGYLIFIECDGAEFHSSPEQMERDAIREQLMIDRGYPVVRFSGADINYSPVACAQRLYRFRRWGE